MRLSFASSTDAAADGDRRFTLDALARRDRTGLLLFQDTSVRCFLRLQLTPGGGKCRSFPSELE